VTDAPALAGRVVVITRPVDESTSLAARVEAAGGEAVVCPALEIAPPQDEAAVRARLAALDTCDFAIFVSPTAVARAFEYVSTWPQRITTAAVGPGTARALARHGIADVILPHERFDSEGLLQHPRLHAVAGRRVLIIRGQGGRETLAAGLRARGAVVEYAECYARLPPAWDPGPLAARLASQGVLAVVVTSSEGLRNVMARLGTQAARLLEHAVVLVPHERIAADARTAGVTRVALSAGAGDAAVMSALGELARAARPTA